MNKYILFYSEQCQYSNEFLRIIRQTPLYNQFVKISIHDKSIKLPSKLKTVPTIVVPNISKPLTGDDVFSWLQSYTNHLEKEQSIQKQNLQQQPPPTYQQHNPMQQQNRMRQMQSQQTPQHMFQNLDNNEQLNLERQAQLQQMQQQRMQQPTTTSTTTTTK